MDDPKGFSDAEFAAMFDDIAAANEDIFTGNLEELDNHLEPAFDKPVELAKIALETEPTSQEEFASYLTALADSISNTSPLRLLPEQSLAIAKTSTAAIMREAGPMMIEFESYAIDPSYGQNDDAPTGNYRDNDLKEMVEARIKLFDLDLTEEEIDALSPFVIIDLIPLIMASETIPTEVFERIFERTLDKEPLSQRLAQEKGDKNIVRRMMQNRLTYMAMARLSSQRVLIERWHERTAKLFTA